MRNKFNFGNSNLRLFFAAVLVMTCVIIYSVGTGGRSDFVTSICSIITTPIQKIGSMISAGIGTFSGEFEDIDQVRAENELLKKKVRELTQKTVDYDDLKTQNEEYRKLLDLKEENDQFKFQPASVIARDASDYYGAFTVDKGSADGVALHDPVITADGLVGIVWEVGLTYSHVRTVLDIAVEVGVYDIATRDSGIVTGDISLSSEGLCQLKYLPKESGIASGNLIVTSGIGGVFPKDYPVGTVKSIEVDKSGLSLVAVIEPTADIFDVTEVLVIKSFNGQSEGFGNPAEEEGGETE